MFVNVVGYLTTIYLLGKYNVEEKFLDLKRIIKYYQRSIYYLFLIEGYYVHFVYYLLFLVFSHVRD